jgi:hypothetical protein
MRDSGRCRAGGATGARPLSGPHCANCTRNWGLDLPADHVLGVLDDYVSRSGYAIAPVVAWLDDAGALAPNPEEVASVHRIRLIDVGRDDAVEFISIPESDRPVIRVRIGERHVHAPTAALIYQFRELAAGRITRVADLEQPVFAWK